MYQRIDFQKLKKINPAIIYTFMPESSLKGEQGSQLLEDTFLPAIEQIKDLFSAYEYGEEHILPFIQSQGISSITPELFLTWLKTIHLLVGETLVKNMGSHSHSGVYTDVPILHWNHGGEVTEQIELHMIGKQTRKASVANMLQLQVPTKDSIAFFNVFDKARLLSNITFSPAQELAIVRSGQKKGSLAYDYVISLHKLMAAYNADRLTTDERLAVNKIIKICTPVEKISASMEAYAVRTVQGWKACDPQDLRSVAHFISESMYQLIDIHPFVNANKRTGSCMMMFMLVSFGLPSIVLKGFNDGSGNSIEEDPQFSLASDQFSKTRAPLVELILKRITSERQRPFSSPKREELVTIRTQATYLFRQIMAEYPSYDINKWYATIQRPLIDSCPDSILLTGDQVQLSIWVLKRLVLKLEQCKAELQQKAQAQPKATVPQHLAMQPNRSEKEKDMSDKEKDEVVAIFERISGLHGGWKRNYTGGNLKIWYDFNTEADANQCKEIFNNLAKSKVLKRTLIHKDATKDAPKKVIFMCAEVNVKALLSINQCGLNQGMPGTSLEEKYPALTT